MAIQGHFDAGFNLGGSQTSVAPAMTKRKTISIKDIARASGASLTTVSLVLNNRNARITDATKRRVLDAAIQLGYRPSRVAQALQAQRAGMLAILVPQLRHAFADVYFGELISAIHDHAAESGFKILLEVAHPRFIRDGQYRELFDRRFVDGMLCLGVTNSDSYLKDFEDGARPMVVVNNYVRGLRLNFVRCDYAEAGRTAARHLLALGHRRIGLIHGAVEVQTSWDLRHGLEETLKSKNVKIPPACLADGFYTEEGGREAAAALLRRDPSITALVAGNDKMAIGAIRAVKDAGRCVPEEVSVIGCDDIHQGEFLDPPLTTIHTPLYDLGRRACACLIELLGGRAARVEEVHPVSLTLRRSTAPACDTGTGR